MHDLSVLIKKDTRSTEEVLLDDLCATSALLSSLADIYDSLESDIRELSNLYWLHKNIDTMRLEPVFQDAIGLKLRDQGITSSEEVLGGISKTMKTIVDKIKLFFKKIGEWFQLVFLTTSKKTTQLLHQLSVELGKPEQVEKLKKEYTTADATVEAYIKLFKVIVFEQGEFKNMLQDLQTLKPADGDDTKLQELENKITQYHNPEREEAENKVTEAKEDENNNDGNKTTGENPKQGGWMDPSKIKTLENTIIETNKIIGILKEISGVANSMVNSISGDTTMPKEIATAKITALKAMVKSTENNIRVVDKYIREVAKKAQIMLNVLK